MTRRVVVFVADVAADLVANNSGGGDEATQVSIVMARGDLGPRDDGISVLISR